MWYLDIQAAEGGDDAADFASQLTESIERYVPSTREGTALIIASDHCL